MLAAPRRGRPAPAAELTAPGRGATRSRCIGEICGIALESAIRSDHGSGPQPVRPRRRPAATRAGRPGCRAAAFDVVLERVARGRAERSVMLTGLRGVGKTVLLNALRSAAVRAGWGTGKLEARPDQSLRRPLSAALHVAIRELGGGRPDGQRARAGRAEVLRAEGARPRPSCATAGSPASRRPAVAGRADSGDIEIDLVELFTDVAGLAADAGRGIALFIDEMQDLGAGRRLGAVRGLPRAEPERPAADRGRRRPAAPAGGAVGQQVLQRAAVPLRADRPAGPGRGRPGAAGAGPRGAGASSPPRRWPRCTS